MRVGGSWRGFRDIDLELESDAFCLGIARFCRSYFRGEKLNRRTNKRMENWKEDRFVKRMCVPHQVKNLCYSGVRMRLKYTISLYCLFHCTDKILKPLSMDKSAK